MNAPRALMLVAAGLLPTPALACTMFWQPFSQKIHDLSRENWAVRADATVHFDQYNRGGVRGSLQLDNIYCYRQPRRTDCPTSLTIRFEDEFSGTNCDSTMWRGDIQPYPRLRYFILSRYDDAVWRIETAYRTFWRD